MSQNLHNFICQFVSFRFVCAKFRNETGRWDRGGSAPASRDRL